MVLYSSHEAYQVKLSRTLDLGIMKSMQKQLSCKKNAGVAFKSLVEKVVKLKVAAKKWLQ